MKTNTTALLILALVCGFALGFVSGRISNREVRLVQAIRAKRDIPRWTFVNNDRTREELFELSEPMELRRLPVEVQKGLIESFGELRELPKNVLTKDRIAAGEFLFRSNLVPDTQGAITGPLLRGFTGFAVKVPADTKRTAGASPTTMSKCTAPKICRAVRKNRGC